MLPVILIFTQLGCTNSKSTEEDSAIEAPYTWFEDCPADEREQRMIDVGDISLNVACRGSGPTVVFLHGFPEFHYSWNTVMDELSSEYRLIAPDQRGINLSDKPEEVDQYHISYLKQDIMNLLPIVSEDPVILVGHDWGGPVGWMVAHDSEAHIRAYLSTNGPHPLHLSHLLEENEEQIEASSYMDLFRSEGAEGFMTPTLLEGMFSDFLSEEDLEIYKEAWSQEGAITGGLNWYRANDLNVATVEEFMQDLSPKVEFPTRVMWGLADEQLLPVNAEGLEEYAADLEVQTFEGVDHWIEHRIPEEIADSIRELDTQTN